MNPYSVLGLSTEASTAEIKAAFRKKIKELHPDTRQNPTPESTTDVHRLIEAYEILSDAEKRRDYDTARKTAPAEKEFNYREWLQERSDNLSKAKLIFYDVLRDRSAEAVSLYTKMTRERAFQLEKLLGKEDFMDCAFMLALELESQGDDVQAVQLFLRICQLEHERPYFRHFFAEVEEHLLHLLTVKITWELDPPVFVRILEELQLYAFKPRAKGAFLLQQSKILYKSLQRLQAQASFDRAKKLLPRDKALVQWEKTLMENKLP